MVSKFKLNEKARVISSHKFTVGDIVTILQIIPSICCDYNYYYKAKDSLGNVWNINSYDLEKINSLTNFEKFKSLTLDQLAQLNVKYRMYNAGYQVMCDFITTDGNLFSDKQEAINYEKKWLESETNEEDGIFNFNY